MKFCVKWNFDRVSNTPNNRLWNIFDEYSNFYNTFENNITKFTIYVHKYIQHIQREVYSNGEKYSKSEFSKYYHLCYISIHQNNNDRISL